MLGAEATLGAKIAGAACVKGVARSSALSAVSEFLKLNLPSIFLLHFHTLSSLCDSSISGLGQNQGHLC
jgi:hypothetical protein